MKKLPWRKWFARDWTSEQTIAKTTLAARGLWSEALNVMIANDTYILEGSRQEMATLLRCGIGDFNATLPNLQASGVGVVTLESNGYVTLESRRLKRECIARQNGRKRQSKFREGGGCNAPKASVSVSDSDSSEKGLEGVGRKGFPVTVDDALAQCSIAAGAVPKEYVMHCFDRAEYRNGCDDKEIPISNFAAYVRTQWKYEQDRLGRESSTHSKTTSNGADKVILGKEYERVIQRMASIRGSYGDHQTWTENDRSEWDRLIARKKELRPILGISQ